MAQLMEVEPAMISLHGRTLKQLYQGGADWEAIGRAAAVVHQLGGHLLGNGDVLSREDGLTKVAQYGVDGFLILLQGLVAILALLLGVRIGGIGLGIWGLAGLAVLAFVFGLPRQTRERRQT